MAMDRDLMSLMCGDGNDILEVGIENMTVDDMDAETDSDKSDGNDELITDMYEVKVHPKDYSLSLSLIHGFVVVADPGKLDYVARDDLLVAIDDITMGAGANELEPETRQLDHLVDREVVTLRFHRAEENQRISFTLSKRFVDMDSQVRVYQDWARLHRSLADKAAREHKGRGALCCCVRALICEQIVSRDGQPTVEVASAHEKLASVFCKMGDSNSSLGHFEQALSMFRCVTPNDHDTLARLTEDTVRVMRRLKRYSNAVNISKDLLFMWEGVHSSDKQARGKGSALHTLATVYRSKRHFQEADSTGRLALCWRQEKLGASHLDVSQSLNFLASLRLEQGETGNSIEEMYAQCLDIVNRVNGPTSANAAAVLRNVSWLYYRRNNLNMAIELKEKEVVIRKNLLKPDCDPFIELRDLMAAPVGPIELLGIPTLDGALESARENPWSETSDYSVPAALHPRIGGLLPPKRKWLPKPPTGAIECPNNASSNSELDESVELQVHARVAILLQQVSMLSMKGTDMYQPELASAMNLLAKLYKKRAHQKDV